jgi:hypothetical protein
MALRKHKKYIKFVWIPAHRGIVLNEVADALAKESICKREDAQCLIPDRDLKCYWKTKVRVAAKEWYRESGKQKGRKCFEYYHQNNDKPWFHRFRLRRKCITSINRIRNGHYCLKECLIQFNIVNTEMCECGEVKETINHILWQCQLFEEFKVQVVEDIMKCKTFPPYCIEDILHCMLPVAVILVARFISSINKRI